MPMHDWKKVPDGIYHAFHHGWIWAISDQLNAGCLPTDYYALPEQVAGRLNPDVLTLQSRQPVESADSGRIALATASPPMTRPRTRFTAESEGESYRRRKKSVVVRHVSDDRVVAIVEIVSPGNKSTAHNLSTFVEKALEFFDRGVHLLIIDPLRPGPRDPNGIHAAIWEAWSGETFELPGDKPLTLVSYECDGIMRAYIEPYAVGEPLPDMPLFLESHYCIDVPLEKSYQAAYNVMPQRWRDVLDGQ